MQRWTGSSNVRHARFSAVVGVLAAGSASAQVIIHVPADVPTIQGAIAQAAAGDTVVVAAGTYAEHLDFLGKAITVASSDGPDVTTVDGSATGTVVTFNTGEDIRSVLRGFTITHGGDASIPLDGSGVAIAHASPTIEGNIINENRGCGPGISISFGSPIVRNNTISNNGRANCPSPGGGGIEIAGAASAQILGNVISGNFTGFGGGGISLFAPGTPSIRGNTISGNTAMVQGGGISMLSTDAPDIFDNVIVGNSSFQGGGIYWLVPSGDRGPFVVNNTIADNSASNGGSGIFADGFDVNVRVVNNIIVAPAGQNAIECGDFNDLNAPAMQANDVVAAAPGLGYAGICADQTGKNGNISVDPLFVDRAGGDFHLQLASPVIDAGTNAAPALPSLDRDGNSRVVDGNGDRVATVDMGAYELSLAPALTIAPASISFADQVVGTRSAAQIVTLTNPGSRAVPIFSTGASGDFAETSHCGPTLAGGASCTIEVRFAPTRVGARAGAISATYAAANSPQAVPLSGNGIAPSRLVTVGSDGGGCSQGGGGGWLALLVAVAEARRLVGKPAGRDSRTRP